MANKDLPFLIVGGGIGGFAAALALARRGIASHLFEQNTDFREIGAGIQLGPNVFKMFDYLDVIDEVSDWAVFPDNIIFRDALSGDVVATSGSLGIKRGLAEDFCVFDLLSVSASLTLKYWDKLSISSFSTFKWL